MEKLLLYFTTATTFSKLISAIFFVTFPFIGFILGAQYQYTVDLYNVQQVDIYPSAIQRISTPTPLVIPTVDPSVTANWKTYSNDTFSYQVKYPFDWILQTYTQLPLGDDSLIGFNPNDKKVRQGDEVSISIERNKTVEERLKFYQSLASFKSVSEISLGGMVGKRIETKNSIGEDLTDVLLAKENYLYSISSKHNYIEIFDQILSTLQFTK